MLEIPTFLETAMRQGLRPTVSMDKKYGLMFDMNTMAKSHIHLVMEGNKWFALMRYDEKHEVEDVEDLKSLGHRAMYGRDYLSADWVEFLLTDEDRAKRQLAHNAMDKLSTEELDALKGYLK
jgi:hypothetical protein